MYVLLILYVQEKHVNLVHIESRKSKRRNSLFEIFVDCDADHEQLEELTQLLKEHAEIVEIAPSVNSTLPDDGRPSFTLSKLIYNKRIDLSIQSQPCRLQNYIPKLNCLLDNISSNMDSLRAPQKWSQTS